MMRSSREEHCIMVCYARYYSTYHKCKYVQEEMRRGKQCTLHYMLGHVHKGRIQKFLKDRYLDPFNCESYTTCKTCLRGKLTNSPFSGIGERGTKLLELIHSNGYGTMSIHVIGGYSYFITLLMISQSMDICT